MNINISKEEATKKYWEYEKELEGIAAPYGWRVNEMLDHHRHELDYNTSIKVYNIIKTQAKLIRITHPHLDNVLPFKQRRIK